MTDGPTQTSSFHTEQLKEMSTDIKWFILQNFTNVA